VPQSAHFNDDPGIKTMFDKWTTVTDQLAAADLSLGQALSEVSSARSTEGTLRAQFIATAEAFFGFLQNVFLDDGSALQSFGLAIKGARGPTPVVTVPVKLRVRPIKGLPGHYTVRWHLVKGAGLYEVQRSPDPEAEATFAGAYEGTRAEYTDSGQVGQIVWFRVRARGATVSDWSAPVRYIVV
jgi:hypothetical protein